MQTPHQNYTLNFPKVNLPILISLGSNLGGIFLMDWDVIEVWWLCGWVLYDPTKFTFRLNVAQPPRKERREGCKIRDIGSRSRKDVWEFVDVVSGSSFKASDKCWIKYMILSVWHFSPSKPIIQIIVFTFATWDTTEGHQSVSERAVALQVLKQAILGL